MAAVLLYGKIQSHVEETYVSIEVPQEKEIAAAIDTERAVACEEGMSSDTSRDLYRQETFQADTSRAFTNTSSMQADLQLRITRTDAMTAMACRKVGHTDRLACDTKRRTGSAINAFVVDLSRAIGVTNRKWLDADRSIIKKSHISCETNRRLPFLMEDGIRSLSVTLAEKTLSDTFTLETVKDIDVEEQIQGHLLDYEYRFRAESIRYSGLLKTVEGMYDVDALLYTSMRLSDDAVTCKQILGEVAAAMGLVLAARMDDYEPSEEYADSNMTYQDLLSSLLGWTSRVPQRQVNVFLRQDKLYAIQRGKEEKVVDISDWPHTRPQITCRLVRSLWTSGTSSDYKGAQNTKDLSPIPFTGTIGTETVWYRYRDGLLMEEQNEQAHITYQYSDGYIKKKRMEGVDGSLSLTFYQYAYTGKEKYLSVEKERTIEAEDGMVPSAQALDAIRNELYTDLNYYRERVTYHSPLGQGWYTTEVYEDGSYAGSTVSQGKPGTKASPYTIDESNRYLSGNQENSNDDAGGTLLDSSPFPVADEDMLYQLTKDLEWLNRKRQEEVNVDIVSPVVDGVPTIKHVIDFTERILLDGHEYYLKTNRLELKPYELRQRLSLVRWYG